MLGERRESCSQPKSGSCIHGSHWWSTRHSNAQELTAEKAHDILKAISDEDCVALGFDPRWSRPAWMVLTAFPVPPPAVRPSVMMDGTNRRAPRPLQRLSAVDRCHQHSTPGCALQSCVVLGPMSWPAPDPDLAAASRAADDQLHGTPHGIPSQIVRVQGVCSPINQP